MRYHQDGFIFAHCLKYIKSDIILNMIPLFIFYALIYDQVLSYLTLSFAERNNYDQIISQTTYVLEDKLSIGQFD